MINQSAGISDKLDRLAAIHLSSCKIVLELSQVLMLYFFKVQFPEMSLFISFFSNVEQRCVGEN